MKFKKLFFRDAVYILAAIENGDRVADIRKKSNTKTYTWVWEIVQYLRDEKVLRVESRRVYLSQKGMRFQATIRDTLEKLGLR